MIYFDASSTTPVRKEVLETFCQVTESFFGNPNSLHELGRESKKLMNEATKQVAESLGVKKEEVIFTSSASEANNMAIKGLFAAYPKRCKTIITTKLEHSSILETVLHLDPSIKVKYVKVDENGHIILEDLQRLLEEGALLVSIHHVNSEIGIIQNIKDIGSLIKEYPLTFFHVDGTQSVGKIPIDFTNVDLFSFSAHKIFGLKGIACLIKKEKINIAPLINGGESQTVYRAGTPSVALIVSLAKALRLILAEQDQNYLIVSRINQYIRESLKEFPNIVINSPLDAIPYILNFSILQKKPETIIRQFDTHKIYISTKTACSAKDEFSKSLLALTNDKEISKSSLRLSFSKDNTLEEAKTFIKILKEEIL